MARDFVWLLLDAYRDRLNQNKWDRANGILTSQDVDVSVWTKKKHRWYITI